MARLLDFKYNGKNDPLLIMVITIVKAVHKYRFDIRSNCIEQ